LQQQDHQQEEVVVGILFVFVGVIKTVSNEEQHQH
jgi:hypothetical protein